MFMKAIIRTFCLRGPGLWKGKSLRPGAICLARRMWNVALLSAPMAVSFSLPFTGGRSTGIKIFCPVRLGGLNFHSNGFQKFQKWDMGSPIPLDLTPKQKVDRFPAGIKPRLPGPVGDKRFEGNSKLGIRP